MKIFYFTSTGNSLYVAKSIGGEIYSIPKLMKEGRYEFEDEKIGIVFPTYYGTVPRIVEEFLSKAKFTSSYIFAVPTYGAISRTVIPDLIQIGKRNQIQFSYINDILMVDNYLLAFDIAEEIKKEPKKNIEENLTKILNDIKNGRVYIKKYGAVMRFIGLTINKFYPYPEGIKFEKNFSVESHCNGCGICGKVCPVDNIEIDKKPSFKGNCQQCLACANHCPQKAICVKTEKSKVRYINKNVTLKEIITSNN